MVPFVAGPSLARRPPHHRQRRRRLKRWVVLSLGSVAICLTYQCSQIVSLLLSLGVYIMTSLKNRGWSQEDNSPTKTHHTTTISDSGPAPHPTSFSQYLPETTHTGILKESNVSDLEQAIKDREPILEILRDARVGDLTTSEILTLPTWQQVETLYGSEPVILGKESCSVFQQSVQNPGDRYIGVSGMFNTGTTAFGISLQNNCQYPKHARNMTNDVLSDSNGMLNQVPWAKHKMATEKYNHTIHESIPKHHVLPIVLVRDFFFWSQSMCKQGYGARWDHDPSKHCPNLVPDDFDQRRFKGLRNASSVKVWMGANAKVGPSWPSLAHYWNAWYQSWVQADFPRLIIRFEDTLFHGKQVMEEVCKCGGGELVSDHHVYLLKEAKQHKHEQNNMISAMIKFGTARGRYNNMTREDLEYAKEHLDHDLFEKLFRYQSNLI